MLILITYDISNDKRRNKVSALLEGYGSRVNFSVFECILTQTKLDKLTQEIQNLITKTDSVRFYYICQNCIKKSFYIGKEIEAVMGDDFFI
ncbi:CRISPR-associated endonuclease Cas2 [Helicobacter sp.]|uniref:CRISPR-associated endonuclease Cas2 n=1 Tax=Helicobacter sp. TaxID=218 RepID=UPI002588C1FA|nr:CRISPR-associated endonuclease Cas2 [Helicobacter sp.]MCI7765409.1 CRISPR-associated endonuclease Cas2 [Helicobacter sp.]